jgi:hypothetical protein
MRQAAPLELSPRQQRLHPAVKRRQAVEAHKSAKITKPAAAARSSLSVEISMARDRDERRRSPLELRWQAPLDDHLFQFHELQRLDEEPRLTLLRA